MFPLRRFRFYRKLAICSFIFIVVFVFANRIAEKRQSALLRNFRKTAFYVKPQAWNENSEDSWQLMGYESLRHYVYSAIFDSRTERIQCCDYSALYSSIFRSRRIQYGTVKVFTILPLVMKANVKIGDTDSWEDDALETVRIHEYFNRKFAAYIVNCPLFSAWDSTFVYLPKYVALTYYLNPQTYVFPTFVEIRYPKETYKLYLGRPHLNLSVCGGLLHMNYSNVLRVVEFIEVHRLLGVEKFYFYKQNVSTDLEKVLDYYKRLKIIEVLRWNLQEDEFENDIRNGWNFVTLLNECLYRSTFVDGFKYTAIVDIDEILVPLRHLTLTDYIAEIDDNRTHSLIFRAVFFNKDHKNDTSSVPYNALNKFLYTQVKIHRTRYPFPFYIQPKCIVRGEMAFQLGNNRVLNGVRGTFEKNSLAGDALLFNYKKGCVEELCGDLITDFSARRFGSAIWTRVDQVCKTVFKSGICSPIPSVN